MPGSAREESETENFPLEAQTSPAFSVRLENFKREIFILYRNDVARCINPGPQENTIAISGGVRWASHPRGWVNYAGIENDDF